MVGTQSSLESAHRHKRKQMPWRVMHSCGTRTPEPQCYTKHSGHKGKRSTQCGGLMKGLRRWYLRENRHHLRQRTRRWGTACNSTAPLQAVGHRTTGSYLGVGRGRQWLFLEGNWRTQMRPQNREHQQGGLSSRRGCRNEQGAEDGKTWEGGGGPSA